MRINKPLLGVIISCIFVVYLIHRKRANRVNLKLLLKYALVASERGGNAILKSKDNLIIKKKGLTKEGLEDRVTNADFHSHCTMTNTMKKQFPSLNVISEESKTLCPFNDENTEPFVNRETSLDYLDDEWVKSEDITVWIDPLDATHEFTEKLYNFVTTMVCISYKGRPIIGVIHKPFQNITSWAWVGKAKSSDLTPAHKANDQNLRISISRSHSGKIIEMLDKKLSDYQLIVAAGAGYKALQVAYGEVDAYLHATAIKKWDICAGDAILTALGGKMTDKENHEINYSRERNTVNDNGLIATLENHDAFLGIL